MARGSNQSSSGAAVFGVLLLIVLLLFAVTLPYTIGASLAEAMGAASPSGPRSALGWTFELLFLALVGWALQRGLVRRANRAPVVPPFDRRAALRALAVMEGNERGNADARIPATERALIQFPGVALVEPRSRNGARVPTRIEVGDLVVTDRGARFLGPSRSKVWRWDAVTGIRHDGDTVHVAVSTRQMVCGMAFPAETAEVARATVDWAANRARCTVQEAASYPAYVRGRLAEADAVASAAAEHPAPPRLPRKVVAWAAASVAGVLVVSTGVTGVAIGTAPEQASVAQSAAPSVAARSADEQTVKEQPTEDSAAAATEPEAETPTPEATASAEPRRPQKDLPAAAVLAGAGDGDDDQAVRIKAGKGTALAALADLKVKGRAPKTGYDRELFGAAWSDVDRNGCDTRNDILARDLVDETFKPGTHRCLVLTGTLADPYTATSIAFQRGQTTSTAVQIDHVVALSDAWQKGAQQISADDRRSFANDPLNLLAVDGPANMQKGDGDAATWLPRNKAFRCQYVARQIAVKKTYKLWVTRAEKDAMERILATCPDERLPKGGLAPAVAVVAHQGDDTTKKATEKSSSSSSSSSSGGDSVGSGGGSVYYENCSAARAAGAAPVHSGDPGYGSHLDRDGDGTGCE
ncbi:DUF1524 domain-containing protein [Isoptericola sp. F-RaC21]|uniref:GmrSD restriction endonuclease domain-containing protein n=1 Tax=Isoptericola sp. F-RaC21 TaxID=3141452 RepID=UPI00315BDC8D